MAVSAKQIEFLARAIVNRLEDRGLVEFSDAETGINIVTRTLEENFATVDTPTMAAPAIAPADGAAPSAVYRADRPGRLASPKCGAVISLLLAGSKLLPVNRYGLSTRGAPGPGLVPAKRAIAAHSTLLPARCGSAVGVRRDRDCSRSCLVAPERNQAG